MSKLSSDPALSKFQNSAREEGLRVFIFILEESMPCHPAI